MPRVGSSRMITPGLVSSHLARTTFCWLPPLRNCTSCAGEAITIESDWRAASITWSSWRRWMMPLRVSRAKTGRVRLLRIDWSIKSPCRLRSSGARARPAAIAWRGSWPRRGTPLIVTRPRCKGSAPKSARATSLRPEPTMPASPTISPSCRVSETPCSRLL